MRGFAWLLLWICTLSVSAVNAMEGSREKAQVHGFASQAFVKTGSDNDFYGNSSEGSFDYTELGLNGSYQVHPKIRIAGQVISRRAGEMYSGAPSIDYGLLDINWYNSDTFHFGTYIGRIKNPLGLYNDTRDVAHTRQGVFTPQVIYFDKVRNLTMSADGASIYGDYLFSNGSLIFQGGVGYPILDRNVEIAYMGQDWGGGLNADDIALVGRLMYEHNGGRWIVALSGATLTLDFDASAADRAIPFIGLQSGSIDIDFTVLSAQYNGEKWQLTAEAAIQEANFNNIGGAFADANTSPLGMSLEANYKFTPQWQAFIRHELFWFDRNDKYGKDFQQASQNMSDTVSALSLGAIVPAVQPAYSRYSRSWVIGGRYDFNQNWMARAEYHLFEGTAILSPRENDIAQAERYWNMFAISLSYKF